MGAGKHVGKVLIQVREDPTAAATIPIKVMPQVYFDPNLVYVIPGGLGGFGLELADWMVLREARKLVLSSSRGISKPYQAYRIKLWQSYGATVEVNTDDITTYEGCKSLLQSASKLGPIGGIFNLAVALRDAIFTNQTVEKFKESFAPKAIATKYLDELSRKMCPSLQYFVVFSSVSCGRGNAGQTNYGMANSIMERIVEQRQKAGLPAKAIQWGAVGEVGLVADMAEEKIDMEIGGTLQQRISSCLQELDILMLAKDPIVSSMVVAEKRSGGGVCGSIIETVMNIMSIRDLKSISMGSSLSEMGMDSLMAVEIKQTLEREFDLFLTPQDLRSLTFQKLQEISDAREKDNAENVKLRLARDDKPLGIQLLLRNLGDESNSKKTILPLITKSGNMFDVSPTLIVPGLEGVAGQAWYNLAANLVSPANILQLSETGELQSIPEITNAVAQSAIQHFKKNQPFFLIGYSYGTLITFELARILEDAGYSGHILLLDGSPTFLKKLCVGTFGENPQDEDIQVMLFSSIVHQIFPEESNENIAADFIKLPGWDKKMARFLEFTEKQNMYSKEYGQRTILAMYNRIKMVSNLDVNSVKPIKTSITLVRPSDVSVVDIDEDYDLSKFTSGKISLKFVEGDHTSMLDSPKLSQVINDVDPNMQEEEFFVDYKSRV